MKQVARISLVMVVLAVGAVLMGCGETYREPTVMVGVPLPMTTDQVVAAVKAGESEDAILSKLQRSGFAGTLTAKDVDQLRAEGVPEGVIDWMLARPGPEPLRAAPIERTIQGVPMQEVVYVEPQPDVVIIERPAPVTWTFGMEYSWGHYYHHDRYYGGYRYHAYPRTRVYHSGGRVYRYTGRH
jgi:hypothetical protein